MGHYAALFQANKNKEKRRGDQLGGRFRGIRSSRYQAPLREKKVKNIDAATRVIG